MKRLYMIFALLISAGVFIGCDSFLDTENLTKKDTSNFPKSEVDARQMVTGIYTVMNNGLTDPESDPFFVFELAVMTVLEAVARVMWVRRAATVS